MKIWMTTAETNCETYGAPMELVRPMIFGSRPSCAMRLIGSAQSICHDT